MATKLSDTLTKEQIEAIFSSGLDPKDFGVLTPAQQKMMPYTSAGATSLKGVVQGNMAPGLLGQAVQEVDPYPSMYQREPSGKSFIFMNKNQPPKDFKNTLAHEMEHALSIQGLEPQGSDINKEWDKLTGYSTKDRANLVRKLAEHGEYLRDNWGLDPEHAIGGYFGKGKGTDYNPNLLQEQFATLSSLEQDKNKRFTDDPYVRKNILTSRKERAAYNALTGLRQTRLDAKDLPPYTPQPDKSDPQTLTDNKVTEKVKSLLGFANGGYVPQAGNNKLI